MIRTWDLQITSQALYQLSYRDIVILEIENYLLKYFKNHAADLGPVLVDTYFFVNQLDILQVKKSTSLVSTSLPCNLFWPRVYFLLVT